MLSLLLSLTLLVLEPCLVVDGPQIQAQDLAAQLAIFATLPPKTALATSPNFGVRREVSSQTLHLWAISHALPESQFDPVCIYRRAAVVEDFAWQTELRQALYDLFGLQLPGEEIQLREMKISPGPMGHIVLQRNGLSYDTVKKQYVWYGKIDGPSGFMAIRITFTMQHSKLRMVAARNLPIGKVIEASDFENMSFPWQPADHPVKESSIPISGQSLRRSLTKGTILQTSHLIEAPLIRSGDTVELISQAGSARIRTPAVARGKARLGDPLLIATLEGKRLLRAIAIAPGVVEIRATTPKKEQ